MLLQGSICGREPERPCEAGKPVQKEKIMKELNSFLKLMIVFAALMSLTACSTTEEAEELAPEGDSVQEEAPPTDVDSVEEQIRDLPI
jgi:hypothetical protein